MRAVRMLLLLLGVGLVALGLVLISRAAGLTSRQIPASSAPPVSIDLPAAAQRLAGSLRIPTVSTQQGTTDPDALAEFHHYLQRSFPRVHRVLERELIGGSALYLWRGRDSALPPILLLAHLDVVPVESGTEPDWSHPPFAGDLAEGFIWGRGALDMKSAVLGLLEAVDSLLADGFSPARTVILAFGHDEEIGGAAGGAALARLLEERGVHPAFVLDEGLAILRGIVPGIAAPVAAVGIAEKGYLSVELSAEAAGGHASMPPRQSAAGMVAAAITALEEHRMPRHLEGPAARLFEFLAPEMSWASRVVLGNLWLFRPAVAWRLDRTPPTSAMLRTTIAPTILEGSRKDNVLPARARVVLNVRIHPADRVEQVLAHIERVIDDPRVRITRLPGPVSQPSAWSPTDDEIFARLQRSIGETFPGVVVAPGLVLGATDSRHYARLTDRIYRFLPVPLTEEDTVRIHGTNERVAVEDYGRAIMFYARLIRQTTASP